MASSALWWSAPEASAQGPQGFRPQTPDELPSTGRVGGSAGRNEAPGTSRNASRSPRGGSSRDTYVRVSRAPNMFGDTLPPQVSYVPFKEGSQTGDGISAFTAPLGGGGSFNVSENNTALPTDRAYFVYNGFFSAASNTTGFGPTGPIQQSVDLHRYLIGLEKTFLDGNVSLDVRMPFFNGIDFQGFGLASENGNIGNLTMYMKGLLYSDDASAWATGLGIGLPTGSDVSTSTTFLSNNETMTVRNESVTLMPFVASTITPNDRWFIQSFGQILFAASGDTVINAGQFAGVYNQQNLLQADMGVGRWLWKDATRPYFSGLAGVMELHYTSTIQNTDVVEMPPGSILGGEVSNSANRVDILNLTSGIHTQLGPMSALRVGAVVPLKQAPDRVFDSEIQVSFNRKF
ncbi:MAG: hypothetical protein ACK5OB_15130 [Pirellula sp.]